MLDRIFTIDLMFNFIKSAIVILVAYVLVWIIRRLIRNRVHDPTRALIMTKMLVYLSVIAVLVEVLHIFNVDMTAIIATAGLFTVTIGIAARSSVSNLIAGFFLIMDRPFEVGQTIKIDATLGVAESIDLISTKIRTFDNLYVRVPNEKVNSSLLQVYDRYKIRRMELEFSLSYGADLQKAKALILASLAEEPLVLNDPDPRVLLHKMRNTSVGLKLWLWVEGVNYVKAKDQVLWQIILTLRKAGMEFPFPRVIWQNGEPRPVEAPSEPPSAI